MEKSLGRMTHFFESASYCNKINVKWLPRINARKSTIFIIIISHILQSQTIFYLESLLLIIFLSFRWYSDLFKIPIHWSLHFLTIHQDSCFQIFANTPKCLVFHSFLCGHLAKPTPTTTQLNSSIPTQQLFPIPFQMFS